MKVAIIGQPSIKGKLALELLKNKCDLPVVISSFMENEKIDFNDYDLIIDERKNELMTDINDKLQDSLLPKYRKNKTSGSKYHK